MPSVKVALANSLLSTITPETAEARRRELLKSDGRVRRGTAARLHDLVSHHPKGIARAFGIDYEQPNLEYIGHGVSTYVVRRNQDEVLKILRDTIWLSPNQRERHALQIQDAYTQMRQYLSEFLLTQVSFVSQLPISADYEAVQIIQPYRVVSDPGLFNVEDESYIATSVRAMHIRFPHAATTLGTFVAGSKELYEDTGLIPDTIGRGNLVIDTQADALLLVDSIPFSAGSPSYQEQALLRLQRLESVL